MRLRRPARLAEATLGRGRAVLAVTMLATVAAVVALVPGYVGVRNSIIASLLVVAGLAASIIFVSLVPRHASVWALTVGPVLAVLAILLGSAWGFGLVVTRSRARSTRPTPRRPVTRRPGTTPMSSPSGRRC